MSANYIYPKVSKGYYSLGVFLLFIPIHFLITDWSRQRYQRCWFKKDVNWHESCKISTFKSQTPLWWFGGESSVILEIHRHGQTGTPFSLSITQCSRLLVELPSFFLSAMWHSLRLSALSGQNANSQHLRWLFVDIQVNTKCHLPLHFCRALGSEFWQ